MKKLTALVFVIMVLCLTVSFGQQNKKVDKSEKNETVGIGLQGLIQSSDDAIKEWEQTIC